MAQGHNINFKTSSYSEIFWYLVCCCNCCCTKDCSNRCTKTPTTSASGTGFSPPSHSRVLPGAPPSRASEYSQAQHLPLPGSAPSPRSSLHQRSAEQSQSQSIVAIEVLSL